MDFVAHLLWSGILFTGQQAWLAIIFGGIPDLIPFGLNLLVSPVRNRKLHRKMKEMNHGKNLSSEERRQVMMDYFQDPHNHWVYKLYNYTHSLIVWSVIFMVIFLVGINRGFFPFFMFAWLLHILIDIPTHERAFFAPQFLTPLSKYNFDGKSWANPRFMLVNYTLIIAGILLRIFT